MFTREKQEMKRVPMMPVRDMVIFPQQMTPFIVGREASVRALEEALAGDKKIFLSTQHDASVDDPKPEEIYAVGTLANIVQSVKLPDGNIKVLVEGVERARAISVATEEGFFRATVRLLGARVEDSPQVKQIVEKVTGLYEQFIKLSQSLNYDTMIAAARKHGKFPGMAGVYNETIMPRYIEMGARFVLGGQDGAFMAAGAAQRTGYLRKLPVGAG